MDRGGVLRLSVFLLGLAQIAAVVPDGFTVNPFKAEVWATNVSGARGIVIDDAGDVLVVARGLPGILALWEEPDGRVNRTLIVQSSELNHGIALYNGYLYASSESTVWRWRYTPGQRRPVSGSQVVVKNIDVNSTGASSPGHKTRSLAVNGRGILFISVGSVNNIDTNSFRARMRSFNLNTIHSGGYEFTRGTVFADGLRNEVGLAFDGRGRLWGVENGADNLIRDDIGGDIHNDNPAEELNLFDGPVGTHYGYPFCWSEYKLPSGKGKGRGTQWTWPTLANGTITDSWCRNKKNVRPPEMTMDAHSAPLGITFFNGSNCGKEYSAVNDNETRYAFGCEFAGDAFVALHGSWNRDVPSGFKVIRIAMNATTGMPAPTKEALYDIFGHQKAESECSGDSSMCIRPVDLKFTREGALLVTSDTTGEIIRVTQNTGAPSGAIRLPVSSGMSCISLLFAFLIFLFSS